MEILLVNVLLFQIQFLSYKTFINILITARKFYFARLLFMTLIYNFIINLYNVLQQYKIMGIKNSEKKIKIFEYLKTRSISMEQYSFKKHIPVKKTQKTRMANLKEQYSFRMEQQTLLGFLQHTQEKNPLFQRKDIHTKMVYNANKEEDQLNTIDELSEMLKSVNNISAKQIILEGIFIVILTLYQKSNVEIQY